MWVCSAGWFAGLSRVFICAIVLKFCAECNNAEKPEYESFTYLD
jgi:hypothetical protein